MICNASPYEGNEPFMFVSYSRKDAGIVYPLIERLAGAGIRIWYDSGIHGGEVWPEVIADHLNRSAACLVFMSRNAVESHNCFNELIFAVENKKPLIPIRYNDPQLTMGMMLMIGSTQWIDVHDAPTDSTVSRILAASPVSPTRGIPNHSIRFQDYQTEAKPEPDQPREPARLRLPVEKLQYSEEPEPVSGGIEPAAAEPEPAPPADKPAAEEQPPVPPTAWAIAPESVPAAKATETPLPNRRRIRKPAVHFLEETLPLNIDDHEPGSGEKTVADLDVDDLDKTVAENAEIPPVIVVLSAEGILCRGKAGITTLGRTQSKSDIVIPDPERKISGAHARLISLDGNHAIEDLNSTNGTWVNGVQLEKGQRVNVHGFCEILLHKQPVLVAFDSAARSLWNAEVLLCLRCQETGETRYIWNGELPLGRNAPWKEGVLQGKKVSHNHALVRIEDGKCLIHDLNSTNGTFVNDQLLAKGSSSPLTPGDIIRIENNHFVVNILQLKRGTEN